MIPDLSHGMHAAKPQMLLNDQAGHLGFLTRPQEHSTAVSRAERLIH